MTTFDCFVYGTLRESGALASILPRDSAATALLDGFAMFEYGGGAYPVIVPAPGISTPIVGDLIAVSDVEALVAVAEMECRSGYTMEWHNVRTIADHVEHRALVFVWLDHDDDGIGRHVPSGDWLSHEMIGSARRVLAGSVVFGDDAL